MILKLTLDLPEHQAYIKITRLLGRTLLEYLRVVEKDIDDIEAVVGELCTNVIRHAQSGEGRFVVVLEYHDDRVVVRVEDTGRGFSFKDIAPIGALRTDTLSEETRERVGGFGLHLVQLLADRLEFRRTDPQGTSVRAEKQLHYNSPAARAEASLLSETEGGEAALSAF